MNELKSWQKRAVLRLLGAQKHPHKPATWLTHFRPSQYEISEEDLKNPMRVVCDIANEIYATWKNKKFDVSDILSAKTEADYKTKYER